MRELLRRHRIFFLVLTAAALALRLLFFWKLRFVEGDSLNYGEIARNLLQHRVYGFTDLEHQTVAPTLIRLPGYPLFMAAIWLVAGVEHYNAIMLVQIAIDVATCFLVAALALETTGSGRAARWAFTLCALCPFFANFAATPLTETPAFFFVALTFFCAAKACARQDSLRWWAGCGAAVAASILLRPDGGILLAALGGYFAVRLLRAPQKKRVFVAGTLVAVIALAPLLPWTIRNWRVFHVVQPLAPRYANDPDEAVFYGYFHWTKTWMIDYVSIESFYWPVPGQEVDTEELPARACDTPDQCRRTLALFDAYNDANMRISPELDAQFEALARERQTAHPFRYYVELPLARVVNIWLRPRTEMLPLDSHWWDYEQYPWDAKIGLALGAINLFYVFCGVMGALTRRVRLAALMLGWIVLRTAFLGTLEAPESRYVLECFPVLIVFAAAWLAGRRDQA
ncbi:MAG TPA: glycosyltransferase family 39 protein [Terriglobales bacterium]|nr:glycosyltransferase family 39 protein [Terriglobales bacterium]